jgi:hypothetical protein
METTQDAIALSTKENDNFYLAAFMLEAWLGQLLVQAAAEYAEKKNPADRSLQTGQAWRGFLDQFGPATDQEFPHLVSSLFRFIDYADPLPSLLRRALVPLSLEHDASGDYFGAKAPALVGQPREVLVLARRSVARWCAWLDAVKLPQRHPTRPPAQPQGRVTAPVAMPLAKTLPALLLRPFHLLQDLPQLAALAGARMDLCSRELPCATRKSRCAKAALPSAMARTTRSHIGSRPPCRNAPSV